MTRMERKTQALFPVSGQAMYLNNHRFRQSNQLYNTERKIFCYEIMKADSNLMEQANTSCITVLLLIVIDTITIIIT